MRKTWIISCLIAAALLVAAGAHALLYGPTNRRIGNQDFSEKKERYGDSDCGLTREIAKYDKWDKGTIEERTKELLELAKLAWPIG